MGNLKPLRILFIALAALIVSACQSDQGGQTEKETPYAVGSSTRFIHDFSRGFDTVAGVDSGFRILITEVWYPVDHNLTEATDQPLRRATYGDYVFGDRDVHRLMITGTTFFHLTPDTVREGVTQADIDAAIDELFSRERNSFVDAPPATSDSPWPVIVMTHGDAGSRYNMETVCEYLAAHGYVVIAPEHTGNTPYAQISRDPALAVDGGNTKLRTQMADVMSLLNSDGTYGPTNNYGQSYTPLASGLGDPDALIRMDRSLIQRLNDLRATLDELQKMNRQGPLAGKLNLNKTGLMGRSYGGATTLIGLALESRFIAGMAIVPLMMPDIRAALPAEMMRPSGEESVLLSKDGPYPLGQISKPTLILNGDEDSLLIGFEGTLAAAMGTTAPTPDNRYPGLDTAVQTTSHPIVWGMLQNSNHGSFGVSGPYWWPALKPDTQERHFEPGKTFTLIGRPTAHQIQKELALNFFDLHIRGDRLAKQKLLDDRFAKDGLVVTSRNQYLK